MLATDPLSLVFIGCAVFSGAFLVISTLLGAGESHFGHLGGHTGDTGGHDLHVGHADSGGAGHAAHAADGGHAMHSAHAHADGSHADSSSAQMVATPSVWASIENTLLGALNLYGLLMFLLVFGLVGYVAHAVLGWGVLFVILVPLLFGVACAIGVTTLLHILFATSKDTELTASDARAGGTAGVRDDGHSRGRRRRDDLHSARPAGDRVLARAAPRRGDPGGLEIVFWTPGWYRQCAVVGQFHGRRARWRPPRNSRR